MTARLWGRTGVQIVGILVAGWVLSRLPVMAHPVELPFVVFTALEIVLYMLATLRKPIAISDDRLAWAASLLIAIYPTLTPHWVHYPLHTPLVLMKIGFVLQNVAVLVEIVGLWKLGRSFSQLPESNRLVTAGVYRFVRHPLYAAYMVGFAGFALVVNQGLLWGVFAVFVWLEVVRARAEEKILGTTFPEYDAYRRKTGMFIPKLTKKVLQ